MQMKSCLPAALVASTVTTNPAYAVAHLHVSSVAVWVSAALLCAAVVPMLGAVMTSIQSRP